MLVKSIMCTLDLKTKSILTLLQMYMLKGNKAQTVFSFKYMLNVVDINSTWNLVHVHSVSEGLYIDYGETRDTCT